jgi:hypothetical protein
MNTLIVYESMYGKTHAIANAIADGIGQTHDVRVVPAADATAELVGWADFVVCGGPTHIHGMSRPSTRKSALDALAKPDNTLTLDPAASGPGMREWLDALEPGNGRRAAAFDTRVGGPALLTGRASVSIAKGLRQAGFTLVTEPESFLVDRQTELVAGELERAWAWGEGLVGGLVPVG